MGGAFIWAEQDPLYENVVVETFDGRGISKFPKGTTARILQKDGSTQNKNISGEPVVWRVGKSLASRYATEGFPIGQYINNWPIDLFGQDPPEADKKNVYGVRVKFDRQGYNYFSVYVGVDIDGKWKPQPLPLSEEDLPGRIKNINIWVWGANYDYTIEMHVQDFKGVTHVLPMRVVSGVDRQRYSTGSLLFNGWRKMAANVPNNISQNSRYSLQGLSFEVCEICGAYKPL